MAPAPEADVSGNEEGVLGAGSVGSVVVVAVVVVVGGLG